MRGGKEKASPEGPAFTAKLSTHRKIPQVGNPR